MLHLTITAVRNVSGNVTIAMVAFNAYLSHLHLEAKWRTIDPRGGGDTLFGFKSGKAPHFLTASILCLIGPTLMSIK